jgi:transcriptional regulator with XRE-family HTH domain
MAPLTLAQKIAQAAWSTRPADRSVGWTKAEICAGTGLSASYVDNLLSGKQDNPTKDVLERLSVFFGIPDPGYFLDRGEDVIGERLAQLEKAQLLAEEPVINLAHKLAGLEPTELSTVMAALDALVAMPAHERAVIIRLLRGIPAATASQAP